MSNDQVICLHDLSQVLSGDEAWNHFSECLPKSEAKGQYLVLREAAQRWWAHLEDANLKRVQVTIEGWHRDGECPPQASAPAPVDGEIRGSTAWSTYTAESMHVLLVLPGFTTLVCAQEQPIDEDIMSTFSARDLDVMKALLSAALREVSDAQHRESARVYADEQQRWYPPAHPVTTPMLTPEQMRQLRDGAK